MPRKIAVIACLLALPAGLVACGGDDDAPGSAQEVLERTLGGDQGFDSGRIDLGLKIDLKGLQGIQGPIDVRVRGPIKRQGAGKVPLADLQLVIGTGGQTFTAGAVSTGETAFVKLQGQAFDLGKARVDQLNRAYADAAKRAKDDGEEGPTLSALGIEPLRWLRNPVDAPDEEVGGALSDHVVSEIDVPKMLEDVDKLLEQAGALGVPQARGVTQGLSAQERETIVRSVKRASFELWSDKADQALRGLDVNVDFDVPADREKRANGLAEGRLGLSLRIGELEGDPEFRAPAGARPFDELIAALSGAVGQLPGGDAGGTADPGAGGGSGSGSTTPAPEQAPAPAPAPTDSKYLQCLQSAGSDIREVQACAELIGQ